jgi:hypothetical protein
MRIEKRDNKVYLTESDYDFFEPRIIISFWEVNIDQSLIPDNAYLEKLGNAYIINTGWKIIPLSITEFPTFTEFIAVKPPRKTGYNWHNGQWRKG